MMASLETRHFNDLEIIHSRLYDNGIPFTGIAVIDNFTGYVKNGEYHREDGPAVIRDNGKLDWYLGDHRYNDINEWGKALGIYDTDEFTMIKLQWG